MANVNIAEATEIDGVQLEEQASSANATTSGQKLLQALTDGTYVFADSVGADDEIVITDAAQTVSAKKFTDIAQLIVDNSAVGVSSGAITVSSDYILYDVTGEGSTDDDLVTISGATGAGQIIILRATASHTITLKNGSGNIVLKSGDVLLQGEPFMLIYDGSNWQDLDSPAPSENIVNGRLTLTTGTPVTTADVTAATTLYFTPFNGNLVSLYDGTRWVVYTFTERSIAIPASTNTNYDVYLYDNSGTLTLELTAWTNDSTRATALTTQDAIYVKTGATGRRYLGSVRTTGTSGQTEDSTDRRFVWNYYNRVDRILIAQETTNSWTYTTDTWREANGGAVGLGATNVDILIGMDDEPIHVEVVCGAYWSTAGAPNAAVGVGLDSSSTNSALTFGYFAPNAGGHTQARYMGHPGIGEKIIYWLERTSAGSGTVTWLGDNGGTIQQSGMIVRMRG